jgi:WD40 repeat protein
VENHRSGNLLILDWVITSSTMTRNTMPRLRSFLSALRPTRLGVLFAVLIGLGVGFWQWGKPPKPRVVLENFGPYAVHHASFSPDGRTLGTIRLEIPRRSDTGNRCSLTLWDVDTGQKKMDLFNGIDCNQLAYSPDGNIVACRFFHAGDQYYKIHVWEVATGRKISTIKDNENWHHYHLVISPKGKLFAVRQNSALWDVAENKIVKELVQDGEAEIGSGDNTILVLSKEGIVKCWDLPTGTLIAERRDIPNTSPLHGQMTSDRRFLIFFTLGKRSFRSFFIYDLITSEKREFPVNWISSTAAIAPDGKTVALGDIPDEEESLWSWLRDLLGIQGNPSKYDVRLNAFPSGEEIIVLKNCYSPVFSPDGRTLLVEGADGKSLQLWDLPIRKPIGKILGLAGLATVATLLAFNGLRWLRRRRRKEHACSPSTAEG